MQDWFWSKTHSGSLACVRTTAAEWRPGTKRWRYEKGYVFDGAYPVRDGTCVADCNCFVGQQKNAPSRFSMVFCAPKATATPPMPTPASAVLVSTPAMQH